MFANRYTALVDACSLVGVLGRNILLSLAEAEFFRLRWSTEILNETEAALVELFKRRGHDDSAGAANTSRIAMETAFPEASVTEYEAFLIQGEGLPDPKDAHVLAAAIATQAQTIITENLKDFPASELGRYGIEARSIDAFIADTISLQEGRAIPALRAMRSRLRRPELTPAELLRKMEAAKLIATADLVRPYIGSL